MTYAEAKEHARQFACVTRRDYGVMRDAFGGCMTFPLSPEKDRYGDELRCEVIRYADIGQAERDRRLALDEKYGDAWYRTRPDGIAEE